MKVKFYLFVSAMIFASGCMTYKLPDAKIKPKEVCGYSVCEPGNFGEVVQFYKKPLSPIVDSTSTIRDIASSIIGRTYPNKSFLRNFFDKQIKPITGNPMIENNKENDIERLFSCSESSQNPFTNYTDVVNLVNPSGKNINYSRTETLNIDVDAVVQGDMEEIKKLYPTNTNLPAIEAKLKATYSRLNNKILSVQAKYSEWALNPLILEKMTKNEEYLNCKEYLKKNKYRIIIAVGIISFDVSFENKSIDKIASELEAEMKQYGVTANLGAKFKREVNKHLETTTKNGYQIVVLRSIDYAKMEGLKKYNW